MSKRKCGEQRSGEESRKMPCQLLLVKGNHSSERRNGEAVADTPQPAMLMKAELTVITG